MTNPVMLAIGNALENRNAAEKLAALETGMMGEETAEVVLGAIKELTSSGQEINLVTVDEKLDGKYTEYLMSCITDNFKMQSQQNAYVESIKGRAERRIKITKAKEYIKELSEISSDIREADAALMHVLSGEQNLKHSRATAEPLGEFIESMWEKKPQPKMTIGIPDVDRRVGKMAGGKYIVIGARPAVGKSILALTAALNTEGPVLFCSYEMTDDEIIGRALSHITGIDAGKISRNDLTEEEKQEIAKQAYKVKQDIHFSSSANTPEKIRLEALNLRRSKGLSAIIIDYLQLMNSNDKSESRRVEVGSNSKKLRQLAIELKVPIIALSQLRRPQTEAVKIPSMSDLRESGDIEQDADVILLLYNHEKYEHINEMQKAGLKPVAFLIEKNRNGIAGESVLTAFDGSKMRFMGISEVRV